MPSVDLTPVRTPHLHHDEPATPQEPPPRPAHAVPRRIDAQIDENLRRAIAARAAEARTGPNDDVLFVGMNSAAGQCFSEAAALAKTARVETIGHGECNPALGADHVRAGGVILDLSTEAGTKQFVATLGLGPEQSAAVAKAIFGAASGSRDELAGIATVFARGERGERMPSRLVISGHSGGEDVYDGAGKLGHLVFADVFALAAAMPKAASRVEDIMLSACSTGREAKAREGRTGLDTWQQHFPNLKTAWGYGGGGDFHSPSGADAIAHVAGWERSARGRADHVNGPRAAGHGYLANNVATWSAARGYEAGK